MLVSRKNYKKGFTLVELLVTISIFVILTGIVLFNQSKFNSTILLTNLAYDTALTIRQAQTYGINIKEFNDGGTGNFVPYGVHFDISSATGDNKAFILFADLDYNKDNLGVGGVFPGAMSSCDNGDGCVNRYSIKRGNYIKDICNGDDLSDTGDECLAGASKDVLDIVFKRPNPDAFIKFDSELGYNNTKAMATIILANPDGNTRKVRVWKNGLIEIVN